MSGTEVRAGDRGTQALLAEGAAHYHAGRHAAAEAVARSILGAMPAPDGRWIQDARQLLAGCRAAVGDLAGAAEALAALVAAAPEHDAARLQLATILAHQGRYPDIVALLAGEVRQRPDFLAAYRPLAEALWATEAREEAVALYRTLVAQMPQDGAVHRALGDALRQTNELKQALPMFRRAVALLEPVAASDPEAHRHLMGARVGLAAVLSDVALYAAPDYAEAVAAAQAVRSMGVVDPEILVGLGWVLSKAGDFGAAEECFAAALDRRPHHFDANLNLSMLRLLRGDFARGWPGYEMRRHRDVPPAELDRKVPWIAPADLRGQCVRVLMEQGAGDRLQFARYLPLLAARGAEVEVAIESGSPLRPLLAEMPAIGGFVDRDDDAPGTADRPGAVVPLMSLALAFGTDLASIPGDVPYLRVPAGRQAKWRARLGAGDGRPRVGVVWWGNPSFMNDRQRSMPLARFAPLLDRPGIAFHVLANRLRPEEEEQARALATVHEGIDDFADTAALVEAMDLVIAVDTAVAHLTGALARPVWMLLPFNPDWRWMLAREDSPWYPTARLFRQTARDDWDGVLQRVGEALDATFG